MLAKQRVRGGAKILARGSDELMQRHARERLAALGASFDDGEIINKLDIGEACSAFLDRVELDSRAVDVLERCPFHAGPYMVKWLNPGVFSIAYDKAVHTFYPTSQVMLYNQALAFLMAYVLGEDRGVSERSTILSEADTERILGEVKP